MTLREANDILHDKKNHWSHEIEAAKSYCIEAVQYLVNAADFREDERADLLIDYLDRRIALANDAVCGNCTCFDPVGHCLCSFGKAKFPSPLEPADDCKYFDPYTKRQEKFNDKS